MKKNLLILLFVFAFTFSSSTYAQDDKYKDYLNLSNIECADFYYEITSAQFIYCTAGKKLT